VKIFPFFQYFDQPLGDPNNPVILNPLRFYQHYKVKLLERCFTDNSLTKQR